VASRTVARPVAAARGWDEPLLDRRPELPALVLAAAAWLVILAASVSHGHGAGLDGARWSPSGAGRGALLWVVMVLAMMLPLTVPSLRYVARMVPRRGRSGAMATFGAAYVVAWLPGAAPAALVDARPPTSTLVVAAGFVAAAAWELTPMKRRALLRCHRHAVVRAHQPARRRTCWSYGLRRGGRCVASCGPAMGALTLSHHSLVPTVVVAVGLAVQQLHPDAYWYRGRAAGVLLWLAAYTGTDVA